jgi:hypothetical protein
LFRPCKVVRAIPRRHGESPGMITGVLD